MHESHLAGTVAAHLGDLDLAGKQVRVLVDSAALHGQDSRSALAAHLAALVRIDPAHIVVDVIPQERICSQCARRYIELSEENPCPACGAAPLPSFGSGDELHVEVVDLDVAGGA